MLVVISYKLTFHVISTSVYFTALVLDIKHLERHLGSKFIFMHKIFVYKSIHSHTNKFLISILSNTNCSFKQFCIMISL